MNDYRNEFPVKSHVGISLVVEKAVETGHRTVTVTDTQSRAEPVRFGAQRGLK